MWSLQARAYPCGNFGGWSFGGIALREYGPAVTDMLSHAPKCHPLDQNDPRSHFCEVKAADGIDYHIEHTGNDGIIYVKERPVRPHEVLPFGVSTTDDRNEVYAKLYKFDSTTTSRYKGAKFVGFSLHCDGVGNPGYVFTFEFNQQGAVAGVKEGATIETDRVVID